MRIYALTAALALSLFVAGPVLAEDAATAPKPAATTAAKPDAAAKAAKAQECSKQADAKNLHGKARKEFLKKCKKGEM